MLHAAQGLICSSAFGYNAYYLAEFGFDASESGVIIAVFSTLTALSLPVFGRIADRSRIFNWKTQLSLFFALSAVLWGVLLVCDYKPVVGILFQLAGLMASSTYPMVNVISFYYEKRGIYVDYGIARSMNSLCYATSAFLLGKLTVRFGTSVIAWLAFIVSVAALWPALTMKYFKADDEAGIEAQRISQAKANAEKASGQGKDRKKRSEKFWIKYPSFTVLVAGSILLMTVFSLTSTFLVRVIEEVGGDSSNLGTALAVCAYAEVPLLLMFSKIVRRIAVTKLLIFSSIMYIVKCLIMLSAGNVWLIYMAQLLQPFAYATFASASVYFSDACMNEEDKATGQTLLTMSGSAGSVFGSLVGGWLVETSGVHMMLLAGTITAVLTTAVVCISVKMYHMEREQLKKQKA